MDSFGRVQCGKVGVEWLDNVGPGRGKTRFAKMANVFERSSSREFTGSGCTVSGLNSSLAFRSDPLGFN